VERHSPRVCGEDNIKTSARTDVSCSHRDIRSAAPADVSGPEDEKNVYRILVLALVSAVRGRGDGSGVSMAVKVGRSARARRRGYMCWCKK
jgi:hypothetical protein